MFIVHLFMIVLYYMFFVIVVVTSPIVVVTVISAVNVVVDLPPLSEDLLQLSDLRPVVPLHMVGCCVLPQSR